MNRNENEMKMLRLMCDHSIKDNIRNDIIKEKVGVVPIIEKLVETCLRFWTCTKNTYRGSGMQS